MRGGDGFWCLGVIRYGADGLMARLVGIAGARVRDINTQLVLFVSL